jgi:hypothetical protein
MKKYILLAILAVGMFTANAQSSTPRFGITKNSDATYRPLGFSYATYQDVASFDSINVTPKAYTNVYKVSLLASDSLRCGYPINTFAKFGDHIKFIINGSNGSKFTFGTNTSYWSTTGATLGTSNTVTLSGGAVAVIEFVFNGTKWVEYERSVPTN